MAEHAEDDRKANKQVFAIPELLEQTLLELPIEDVLVNAQRVSRAWHNTIRDSPSIQQALFFEPVPVEKVAVSLRRQESNISPKWTLTDAAREDRAALKRRTKRLIILQNPLRRQLVHKLVQLSGPRWVAALARPEASWRRMFVSQPPIQFTMGGNVKTTRITLGELAGEPESSGGDVFTAQTWIRWMQPATGRWRKVRLAKDVRRKLL